MKVLTIAQFRERLRARVQEAGSQRNVARSLGISDAYLSDVLAGRRDPSAKLARMLGYTLVKGFILST